MKSPTLGFVGLGNMGNPMCRRLIDQGYTVFLYDVNPEAFIPFEGTGTQPSMSLADLARHVEVILLSLPNSAVVEQVIMGEQGLHVGLSAGQVIIDLSSSKPSSTRHLATVLDRQHVHLLDAPVSGGVSGACEGTLTILVGGDHEVFEQQVPLLQALGTQIFYMGGHGAGHLTKSLNNLLASISLTSAIEAVLVGSRYGLDPGTFIAAVNASTGRSHATEIRFPRFILPETFDDRFALELMNKDVHIALEAAADVKIPIMLGICVGQIWQEAEEQGFGRSDHTALYTFLKNRLDQHKEETMKITRIDRTQAKGDPSRINYFDGEVQFQSLVSATESNELDLLNVCFSAGARTRPHIHQQDQVLYIVDGQGIVATETEKHVVSAGDVIIIPSQTWHWHGATRNSAMSHISVMKRGQTDWTPPQKNWAAAYDE